MNAEEYIVRYYIKVGFTKEEAEKLPTLSRRDTILLMEGYHKLKEAEAKFQDCSLADQGPWPQPTLFDMDKDF